ncbi:MAG: M56 family metallopeptidase [Flavobacteriaceae bacterium]
MELLTYIIKSAGVLLLFYTVYFFLLQKDTLFHAKRQFLLFGLVAAIILPFIELTKTIIIEIPEITNALNSEISSKSYVPQLVETFSMTLWDVVLGVYGFGVLVMAYRFAKELSSLIRIFISGNPEKIEGVLHIKTSQKQAPFSFFNYIVYNPSLHSDEELQMIIKHEKVHASQWHSADILLANLLLIFQWINPIAWLFKNSIEENLEFIADNKTVQQIASKKAYQLALVKASSTYTVPALTNNFYQSFIKKRIIMLNKSNSRKVNVLKIGIILPLLALFLWSFNVTEVITYKTIPKPKESINKSSVKETPIVNFLEQKEDVTKLEGTKVTVKKPSENITQSSSQELTVREKFSVKITKNTSNEAFEKIKKELKEKYGIDLSYTVVRNDVQEIVSLTMNYSSTDSRNGNYQVTDDDGIDEFHFYIDEEGKSGFWSEATEERRVERMERRTKEMEERKEEMEIRREKINEEMEVRREEMKERKKEMDKRRKEKEIAVYNKESNEAMTYAIANTGSGSNRNLAVISGSEDSVIINKNTSDAELSKMKTELASKNIDFAYKNVKRNDAGEIVAIKISIDDNKGSKSTTVIKSDDDKPIDLIVIHQ